MSIPSVPNSVPDLQALILDRLMAFHSEIPGIQHVYRYPTKGMAYSADIPLVYHLIGDMNEPAPGVATPRVSAGTAIISRNYVARLVVGALSDGIDDATLGAEIYAVAEPFYHAFAEAYLLSPFLKCQTAPHTEKLSHMADPLTWRDTGIRHLVAGNTAYGYIDFILTLNMRVRTAQHG